MAIWQITISGKGLRKTSVEKLVEKMKSEFGEDCSIFTKDATPPTSRSERFDIALNEISMAKSDMEGLRDELQEWLDGLPENLQNGEKAEQLQTTISELEDIMSNIETVEDSSIEFPGMY